MTSKTPRKSKAKPKTKVATPKGLKITFAVYVANQGDGSASARIFPDEETAEKFASKDDERYCDDISSMTIFVDDKGNLLPPPETKMREDGVLIEEKIGKCYLHECSHITWNYCGRCGKPTCKQHSIKDSSCEEGYICSECKQRENRLLRTRNPGPGPMTVTVIHLDADIQRVLKSKERLCYK